MDLFGDIDDISSDSDGDNQPPIQKQPVKDGCGVPQNQQEEEPISETKIEVEIPNINSDLGNELYFVKLPKFLSIESKPFDPQYYEDEFENKKMLDEERTRLKLKIENTIRWRIRRNKDGIKIKESNARIVKWSDGSLSLHLGNEVFDIYKAPMQANHNHLFIREDTGLQGQAVFKSKLTFRPHATDYATHKKVTLPLASRCSRLQMIRILPVVGPDPECQRVELIKSLQKEAARLRASAHQETIRLQKQGGPSAPYQDPNSDEEGEAVENHDQGGRGEEGTRIYSPESDEGQDEDGAQRSLTAKKLTTDEMNPPERGKQRVKRKRMTEA
ncbi:RNA polymerase-associated protein LEO1-like [Ovis aries]|uniref:Uncharacterized protein n=1 Tax=Ovis aries TaxID=9940 RepID=A0AC11EP79_SHEEP|nr:RNA polymerase-associated protein LEO1-like [Ovis aries]XP_060273951.1 RNA polymerase-associated protein LEO1-like [Ovis aries]